jgi:hypothetical protein
MDRSPNVGKVMDGRERASRDSGLIQHVESSSDCGRMSLLQ